MLNAACSICGNVSGYDKESLEGSTWDINGIQIVLCCPCEDDLVRQLPKGLEEEDCDCCGKADCPNCEL